MMQVPASSSAMGIMRTRSLSADSISSAEGEAMFRQMIRQVYNAETYSLTGKIENIVGMSVD